MPRKRTWTIEQLKLAVDNNLSIRGTLEELGLKPTGGNYQNIKKHIRLNNIDTAHFLGQGWYSGEVNKYLTPVASELNDILVEYSTYSNTSRLKKKLIAAGLLINLCTLCGQEPLWQGLPLTLHLDHINGIHSDNRIENLRILCPNCHTQTKTYGSSIR